VQRKIWCGFRIEWRLRAKRLPMPLTDETQRTQSVLPDSAFSTVSALGTKAASSTT
jgi:hypothetical protein